MRGAIREGVFPGAALVVGRHDTVVFAKGYGRLTWRATSPVVSTDSTLWDLASLTKVVATTPALMLLVEQGKVVLDSPVVRYIPEFNSPGTAGITVRHLLTHTSGLRATLPLREARDSAAALMMVLTTVPVVPPGTRMVYSDLNAILLGEIVRRVSGQTLDAFVTHAVYTPLGLDQQLLFRPSKRLEKRIAPTGMWHGHPIAGASVTLPDFGLTTRSRRDGSFVFRSLPTSYPYRRISAVVTAAGFNCTVAWLARITAPAGRSGGSN